MENGITCHDYLWHDEQQWRLTQMVLFAMCLHMEATVPPGLVHIVYFILCGVLLAWFKMEAKSVFLFIVLVFLH